MNLPGGEVEVRAGGTSSSLQRLRRALEVGPTGATVETVADVVDGVSDSMPYPFAIHR
jgi:acylphosphatase